MKTSLILLLIICPFAGFLINLLVGKKIGKTISGTIANIMVAISFVISVYLFFDIQSTGKEISLQFFDWITLGSFTVGFHLLIDQLSALWLLIVTGIGFLIHLYSIGYMKDDENIDRFFSNTNLFIFFMIILVTAGNLGIMFIGWEGVGLSSYLLIGFWYKNQKFNDAAKKAFIMNRIGDLGFLAGLFIIAYLFKTIDFHSLRDLVPAITSSSESSFLLGLAAFFLFIGATGKSAQIPLYTWLPDAMAGPTPVSALIHAATMVTAGIFMITRLNFIFDLTPEVRMFITVVGAITALFAATIAIVQNDIKKVLAYSTVSQLGIMFVALGLGAYHMAVFHVITHAFFKACLFLGAGSVIHAMNNEQNIRKMGGLRKKMKYTYATFFISTLSISGIPPFAGFFSKDDILLTAFNNNVIIWILIAITSLFTAFYMFRVLFLTFFGKFRGTEEQEHHLHESSKIMTVPLIILATLAAIGGVISLPVGFNWLREYLTPVINNLQGEIQHHPFTMSSLTFMLVSVVIAMAGFYLAYYFYIKNKKIPEDDRQIKGFFKVLYNKYYVDEIYNFIFVKPIYKLSGFFKNIVEKIILSGVLVLGKGVSFLSVYAKVLQTGNIAFYLFVFVLSFCSVIIYLFLI